MSSRNLIDIPKGATAGVKIIDTTGRIGKLPTSILLSPAIDSFDYMPKCPSWSFLIESQSGQKVLFDLGIPIKWKEMAPRVSEHLSTSSWEIEVEKEVPQILEENSVPVAEISAVIWR
jgi:hypothetical protein